MNVSNTLGQRLSTLRQHKPTILCIANSVTAELQANVLNCLGASPLMSGESSELNDLVGLCSAVSLNIGTASTAEISLFCQTAALAKRLDKGIVLDPVGCGASTFRYDLTRSLINASGSLVLKLNGSEALALVGALGSQSTGVDSRVDDPTDLLHLEDQFRSINETVVVTGKTDLIIGSEQTWINHYGHPVMTQVSGMGCVLGGIIAAFSTVTDSLLEASLLATVLHGMIGEQAARSCQGPGSFSAAYLDSLASADPSSIHFQDAKRIYRKSLKAQKNAQT